MAVQLPCGNRNFLFMATSISISCFLLWAIFNQTNSATIGRSTTMKSQEAMRQGDAGGVYIPRNYGNELSDLHYGIVIDCGSSGSRLYIYVWPDHSGNPNELLQIKQLLDREGAPVVKKIEPGLSSMADTPTNATEYLKSLLDFAAEKIPPKKHSDTPLYILATAGMRFLSQEKQKRIIADLFNDTVRDYNFLIEKTHIQVITGQFEGIYSWIAINYVLGRFQRNNTNVQRQSTVGILDMGGASAQIAFEVADNTPVVGEEIAEFHLDYDERQESLKYKIYVTTFLGYGVNKVYEKYIDRIVQIAMKSSTEDQSHLEINDADCLPRGFSTNVTKSNISVKITGEGDFANCSKHLVSLLNLNATCLRKPCSFNGVYQPSINYTSQDFYGFSEFWYTMQDVLKIGGPYARLTFLNASINYCNANWNDIKQWYDKKMFSEANLNRLMSQCFKSAWLYAFLHDGLKFPVNYQRLRSASLVNNNDVQWTLGAMIYKTRFYPLKSINRTKVSIDHYETYRQPRILFILLCMILTICLFLYAPQRIRFFLSRRTNLQSQSNDFNHRYQLLKSFSTDDLPAAASYSANIKAC
ncbi:unnamed protein product [Adineta ricciae]|uniref:Uncharacterized protein n=1 Tax=Adineta ricciae TaxID=249248 RepID=A0A815DJF3_ADIRI|nr:unnamed protein product [Adineta ricciae]CAF1294461.1 unnamed protein product [Adineta ricciae]